jgi:protein SCO1/2
MELRSDGRTVVVKHEAIPDYMPAMTMPMEVKDTNELKGLDVGDAISFQLVVAKTDAWVEQLRKLDVPRIEQSALPPMIRVLRDVEPLNVGDALPEYHFTNQLGQAVSLSQFRGQALAITFIFTRCPFPTFCPLMSRNFEEVQTKLLATPGGPTNWHLLTITFDPQFDTPPVLKAYAERFEADPAHWNFLTGDLTEITAIAEQFGELFWREQGSINHNLRTIIINTQGRVQNIIQGNTWTVDDLTQELKKATLP